MCTFYGLSGVGAPDLSDSGYLRFSSTSTRSTESTIPIRCASVTIASVQMVITHEYTPAAVRRNSMDPRPGTGSLYGLTVSFILTFPLGCLVVSFAASAKDFHLGIPLIPAVDRFERLRGKGFIEHGVPAAVYT